MAELEVLNPFDAIATLTGSSETGHHVVFGGDSSCDMDVHTNSRGAEVKFRLAGDTDALRGVVALIGPACADRDLDHGGSKVVVDIVRVEQQGNQMGQVPTGLRLIYAHLDPVSVAQDDVLVLGQLVGKLGPAVAQDHTGTHGHGPGDPRGEEYHSSCCTHSHLHLEGVPTMSMLDLQQVEADTPILTLRLSDADADTDGGPSLSQTHTVVAGDTLGAIAMEHGTTVAALVAANDIENADLIHVGQVLTISS